MTNFRPVTQEEKRLIINAFKQGMPIRQIKHSFKRANPTIMKVLSESGIELPKQNYDGLMSTKEMTQLLGISNNSFARIIQSMNIQAAAENNFGGRFYTDENLKAIRVSDEYKAVLESRLHRKRITFRKKRVSFPYNPSELARCTRCANFCSGNRCNERNITISRLSVRSAFYDCNNYSTKEKES